MVLEKHSDLEELYKKCEVEKKSLRDEIMERTHGGDEGYKTMEFIVGKEKQELEYQLQDVRFLIRGLT